MYFWNTYPFIRFTIALILGIVCHDTTPSLFSFSVETIVFLMILYVIGFTISTKMGFNSMKYTNGIIALSIIFFIGGHLTKTTYHSHSPTHYLNLGKFDGFSGIVLSDNEKKNHIQYEFELISGMIKDSIFNIEGTILLNIQKDSLFAPAFQYGDHLLASGSFYRVIKPKDSFEFNYQLYLERQNIFSQAYIKKNQVKLVKNIPPSKFFSICYSIRDNAEAIIDQYISRSNENGIAKAILLGIKDEIDNKLKASYATAGAMHILAVSGLHVGIIYFFIQLLLVKLKSTQRGKIIVGLISLVTIWFYTIIAGLSPSIIRAAIMFTIAPIGQIFNREGNVFNNLGIAAFILLLLDPYNIYAIGFQLSFTAVLGICYLQPKLYHLVEFNNIILDKAWSLTCVSIAAQLATSPLSIYYFHQFPTYFLFTNLLIIPFAFISLVLGIVMLLLASFSSFLTELTGYLFEKVLLIGNYFINWVDTLPGSSMNWLYIDTSELLLIYLIILLFLVAIHCHSFKTLTIATAVFLFVVGRNIMLEFNQSQKHKLVIHSIANNTAFDIVNGLNVTNISKKPIVRGSWQEKKINNFRINAYLHPIHQNTTLFSTSNNFFCDKDLTYGVVGGKKILIVDSTTFHLRFDKKISTDILIINNESIKSLDWLVETFTFEQLVFGSNNSYYYMSRMLKESEKLGLTIFSLNNGIVEFDL